MSSTSSPSQAALQAAAAAAVAQFAAGSKPTLNAVIITHTFLILMFPLLICLFYFSTPRGRLKPIFLLNVVAIALAFISGVILDYRGIRILTQPLNPPPLALDLATGVLGAFQSLIVDIVLLLRLTAVYPRSYVGLQRFVLLITLPIVLKVARLINLIIFIKVLADATRDPVTAPVKIIQVWEHAPYLKIEWFMQLFDNSYASGFFLWRLVLRDRDSERSESYVVQSFSTVSFTDRLRTLFWIAVTNFVIPVLFSLVQIIIVYREVDAVVVNEVVLVNTMLAVVGVVFATIWAGSTNMRRIDVVSDESKPPSNGKGQVLSTMVFNRAQSATDVDADGTISKKETE